MKKFSETQLSDVVDEYYGETFDTAFRFTKEEASAQKIAADSLAEAAAFLPSASKARFRKKLRQIAVQKSGEFLESLPQGDIPATSAEAIPNAVSAMREQYTAARKRKRLLFAAVCCVHAIGLACVSVNVAFSLLGREEIRVWRHQNNAYISQNNAVTFTDIYVLDGISVGETNHPGKFIVAEGVFLCENFALDPSETTASVRIPGENGEFLQKSVQLNANLTQTMSIADLHIGEDAGLVRGKTRLVYEIDEETYNYLFGLDVTYFDISDRILQGDGDIRILFENIGETPVSFEFFSLDFLYTID